MATDPLFRMTVKDVFRLAGRGTVVTGQIERGTLNVGDELSFQRDGLSKKTVVTGIEQFRKQLQQANAGDNVGVLLGNVEKSEIQPGDVLVGSDSDSEFTWNP